MTNHVTNVVSRGLRKARRTGVNLLNVLERPVLTALTPEGTADGTLLCVYRLKNTEVVRRLVRPAVAAGWTVGLWALDQVSPDLEKWTLGSGPGSRTDLLNRLYRRADPAPEDHVVIADDDVVFTTGDVTTLTALCVAASFWLAQPAHERLSYHSYPFTRGRHLLRARTTEFVEIGPIVVISPEARQEILPFPDDFGMGWGLAVLWSQKASGRHRIGIVDASRVRHLSKVAAAYGTEHEAQRLRRVLRSADLDEVSDLHVQTAAWPLWCPRPPWPQRGRP